MKLSINHSLAMIDLVQAGEIYVDAVEVVPHLSLEEIKAARSALPGMDFHYHHGSMIFSKKGAKILGDYLQACPASPFISIHLAPLPTRITNAAMNRKIFLDEPDSNYCIKVFVKRINRLKTQFETPIILENMPTLHPKLYRFESEPEVIKDILEETGCPLLLDLAHARIAADARQIPVRTYLSALPLERTVQVHLAGVRVNNGSLYDAHEHLLAEDYDLLDWVLARTNPYWITLEYFKEDREQIKQQITRLQQYF